MHGVGSYADYHQIMRYGSSRNANMDDTIDEDGIEITQRIIGGTNEATGEAG